MGTRSEIHIRDKDKNHDGTHNVIELWKHWDGYPDSMKELFEEFAVFMKESCGNQPHRLMCTEDLAALLISKSYLDMVKQNKKMAEQFKNTKDCECYPDIRPRGIIEDAEYIYLLEIDSDDNTYANAYLHVKCYDSAESAELREQFRNGTEPDPKSFMDAERLEEYGDTIDYKIPLNLPGQSCVICG